MKVNAVALSGITPDAAANVTMNVHGLVAGTGNRPSSGTFGPTAVASTRPRARWTETVSPWIASTGWARLALTIRPTGTLAFGSQLGIPPYLAADPLPGCRCAMPGQQDTAQRGEQHQGQDGAGDANGAAGAESSDSPPAARRRRRRRSGSAAGAATSGRCPLPIRLAEEVKFNDLHVRAGRHKRTGRPDW